MHATSAFSRGTCAWDCEGYRTVIEARTAIETEAASLAAERRTPAELRAMRRALAERRARSSAIEEHVDADMAFHRAIVAAAHNPILLDLFDDFVPRSCQAMLELLRIHGTFGGDADQGTHPSLLEAIANRDSLAAIDPKPNPPAVPQGSTSVSHVGNGARTCTRRVPRAQLNSRPGCHADNRRARVCRMDKIICPCGTHGLIGDRAE